MGNEITEAVVENAATEVVTEAAKQSWSAPEICVLVLAGVGAFTVGKKVGTLIGKGIGSAKNWWTERQMIKAEYAEEAPVVDIQDCNEVVEDTKGKSTKK